jgi:hypothetical protein
VMVARELPARPRASARDSRPRRAADGHDAPVDAWKLARGIAERSMSSAGGAHSSGTADRRCGSACTARARLCAAPEATAAPSSAATSHEHENERPLHLSIISDAAPSVPVSSGTTSRRSSWAQIGDVVLEPGGPYVRALSPSSALGKARASSSVAVAACVRSPRGAARSARRSRRRRARNRP